MAADFVVTTSLRKMAAVVSTAAVSTAAVVSSSL